MPVECNLVQCWDLSIVLGALSKFPFELRNMASIDLKLLTFKTLFLLGLASGARQGEIHALDISQLGWTDDGKEVLSKTICRIHG